MRPELENLPRTITLSRAQGHPYIPEGFPIVSILDQTKLPYEVEYLHITDWREIIERIKSLKVRGAPAIGIAGAAAVMLRGAEYAYSATDDTREQAADFDRVFVIDEEAFDPSLYKLGMDYAASMIKSARPTAVNLEWAVDSCTGIVDKLVEEGEAPKAVEDALYFHVEEMIEQDEAACRTIGENGARLLGEHSNVITHCNAGSLATAFYGTALGVIYSAAQQGKIDMVYADETRPVGQGARLTVWELSRAKVPVTLICDSMSSFVMANNRIDAVIVGADRIARNGDTANKIGTLGLAIAAKHFGVPFYVAAPTSTVDAAIADGAQISIEMRDSEEVLPIPMEGVEVLNPSFDVTPANLIEAIITERGVFAPQDIEKALS